MPDNIDIKYKTTPHDGTPGKPWEDFEERLLDVAAGVSDDRGWSLADCFNRVDEGGAAGPPLPAAGTADGRKALASQRKRLSESYSLLTTHEYHYHHVMVPMST